MKIKYKKMFKQNNNRVEYNVVLKLIKCTQLIKKLENIKSNHIGKGLMKIL